MPRLKQAAVLAASVAVLASPPAVALSESQTISAARGDAKKFLIDPRSLRVEKVGSVGSAALIAPAPAMKAAGLEPIEIINAGKKVWDIIKEHEPVVDVSESYATALPRDVQDWTEMEGWRTPAGVTYRFTANNLYGVRVVDVTYQVLRTYGGSYRGKGRYLTAVTVQPLHVHVLWGYDLSLSAEVPPENIVNAGAEPGDPIAAMTLQVSWRIKTLLVREQGMSSYYLRGDGFFLELGERDPRQALARRRVDRRLEQTIPSLR